MSLSPERLMNLVYARTFKNWALGDKDRRDQPMDFLLEQFDQMLAVPVPGQVTSPADDTDDYLDDYRALMGKG